MNILVFNCGSSSLKYKMIEMPSGSELIGGEAQRVGPKTAEPSRIINRIKDKEETIFVDMANHGEAFKEILKVLEKNRILKPDVLGHRLVHGAALFKDNAVVTPKVISDLESIQDMAPIHNPPAISLVKACAQISPNTTQVVVFDTVYHSTMPDYAYTYALPKILLNDYGIRKYGFHGTSHHYVANEAAKLLGIPLSELNAVSCHLGSGGASLCAIVNGKSIDNTMGFSPLQGLVMSTRCGDLDPAITLRLLALSKGDYKSVEKKLNKLSGVLGMSGISSDIRDIFALLEEKKSYNESADLTAQVYTWRIKKYLGGYLVAVGKPHAVIFTDTIGETVPEVRAAVCSDMGYFGIELDYEKNKNVKTLPSDIASDKSNVRIFVIQTNEEISIARQTYNLICSLN